MTRAWPEPGASLPLQRGQRGHHQLGGQEMLLGAGFGPAWSRRRVSPRQLGCPHRGDTHCGVSMQQDGSGERMQGGEWVPEQGWGAGRPPQGGTLEPPEVWLGLGNPQGSGLTLGCPDTQHLSMPPPWPQAGFSGDKSQLQAARQGQAWHGREDACPLMAARLRMPELSGCTSATPLAAPASPQHHPVGSCTPPKHPSTQWDEPWGHCARAALGIFMLHRGVPASHHTWGN